MPVRQQRAEVIAVCARYGCIIICRCKCSSDQDVVGGSDVSLTKGGLYSRRSGRSKSVSCTVAERRRTAAGRCSAWNETERVRRIENKSNSQGVILVYWNSKISSEGGVQGCRRLAFRLVCDLSPPACLPGRTQSVMQEVRLNPGSATHHPPCPWAGHADSLAACRPCKSTCRPEQSGGP